MAQLKVGNLASLMALIVLIQLVTPSMGVVVDGKKDGKISATKHQSSEDEMIDSYSDDKCGFSDPNYNEHEFVNMAREGQFPWLVSFQIAAPINSTKKSIEASANKTISQLEIDSQKEITDQHFCCGSLINERWILSAAHCFSSRTIKDYLEHDRIKVVAGSNRVSSRLPVNLKLRIKRIFYHGSFRKEMPVGFDIALVELVDKVKFQLKRSSSSETGEQAKPFLNTICLPLKDKHYKVNETVRVAGWGLSRDDDPTSMPSKLLTTDIQINQRDRCANEYSKILKSDGPKIQANKYGDFLCASHNGTRDACQSDSGAPLMEYANQRAVVVGIVSYGVGCATKGIPGLYTRTSVYINWIRDITKNGREAAVSFQLVEPSQESKQKLARLTKDSSIRQQARKAISSVRTKIKTMGEIAGVAKRPKGRRDFTSTNNYLSESLPSSKADVDSALWTDLEEDTKLDKYFSSDFRYFDQ